MPPHRVDVVWDDRFLEYDFGPGHPFTERSRAQAVRLLESLRDGLHPIEVPVRWTRTVELPPTGDLERFHTAEYLERVRELSGSGRRALLDQGDTPSFPGCFPASARLVGGTLRALDLALGEHGRAFAPGGGLHHARPGRASGFCIFNDLAVAISSAFARGRCRRMAYIDIDAHHGDGVMYGFYSDGRLLDIDFHQDGRTIFPGTGFPREIGSEAGKGLKVNVPLPPGTGDRGFRSLFERIVPPLVREFDPELILLQCGVDAHVGDQLGATGLAYTPQSYRHAVQTLEGLAVELGDRPLVITGGGGYTSENVARILAAVPLWLTRTEPPPETRLPSSWRAQYRLAMGHEAPLDWTVEGVEPPWSMGVEERLISELESSLGRKFPVVGPSD